jgi:hypothetical protein
LNRFNASPCGEGAAGRLEAADDDGEGAMVVMFFFLSFPFLAFRSFEILQSKP